MIQPLFALGDYGILVLRIILGIILVNHGLPKLRHLKGTGDWMASIGFKPGRFWAAVVGILEFIGGILLVAGFFAQIVSVLVALQFLAILLIVKRSKKLAGGFEFDFLILGAAVLLATTGGGAYGLDEYLGILLY